jgi:NhaP-type Na+/H+ or K+/H+ antiporter
MHEHIILGLTTICIVGAFAQWLGWKLRLPPIIFLLVAGFAIGPITGFVHPDKVFGDLLFPMISLAVSIILFEGGLTLNLSELKQSGKTIWRLILIGGLIGWVLGGLSAYYFLKFPPGLSALTGAILIITGPTVIAPMLRVIRPGGKIGDVAKWEGIVNDPIGALIAVLVYEAMLLGRIEPSMIALELLKTIALGTLISFTAAGILILLETKRIIPKYLQNFVILAFVFGTFALSNHFQAESGLLSVTLFGVILANQSYFQVSHVIEFKENLRVLIISGLFVVLAARLEWTSFQLLEIGSFLFLASLILVVRPAVVLLSTLGTNLKWNEKVFLMLVAPRGIVVVALTSIVALSLEKNDFQLAQQFFAEILFVVLGTVLVYGSLATWISQKIGISNVDPQGVLFVGAHSWARRMAKELKALGLPVFMIDSNEHSVETAQNLGIPAASGNVFSEEFLDQIDFSEMGHMIALTANDEVNAFAESTLSGYMADPLIYHLKPGKLAKTPFGGSKKITPLFSESIDFQKLEELFGHGAKFKTKTLAKDYKWSNFLKEHASDGLPLFCVFANRKVSVFNSRKPPQPKEGDTILFILHEADRIDEPASNQPQT